MNIIKSLRTHLDPNNLSSHVLAKEEIYRLRETILQYNLNFFMGIGFIGFLLRVSTLTDKLDAFNPVFFVIILLIVGAITFGRRIAYAIRASSFLLIFATIGTALLFRQGLSGSGPLLLLAAIILAGLLLGRRMGFSVLFLGVAFVGILGFLMTKEIVPLPRMETLTSSTEIGAWLMSGVVILYAGFSLVLSINLYARGFSNALQEQIQLATQLQSERQSLEVRVRQRTEELDHRASRMETARRIGSDITRETDVDNLLIKAVNLIKEEFAFYHAGLFVIDERGEYAVLRAATGEAGKAMLQKGHRLKIGEVGIVGYVASRGEARITPDVTEDMNYYKNPALPDTRSEMAIPLRTGDKTVGALDVQSSRRNAFTPADVEVLQIIADQLANALEKASLLRSLQISLKELEDSSRQRTQQSWRAFLRNAQKVYGYQYQPEGIALHQGLSDEAEKALRQASLVATQLEPGVTGIAVPIKLRGQPIGVVNLRFASTRLSNEMIELVNDATDRLAVSLENARLLEELQYRAQRERMVGEISSKVRTATDVESILRIAANELGQSLGVAEVVVQLHAPD